MPFFDWNTKVGIFGGNAKAGVRIKFYEN